jgi:6-phosphogluconate dehydrogenase
MPGGSPDAWPHVKDIFQSVSAKVEGDVPCCDWVGEEGAGHYVKMVHNGIEYADMQLICEAYFLMKHLLKMKPPEMSKVFADWNRGDLDSFLIEITADILQQRDPKNPRKYLVDSVLDTAGQKGTGKWTSVNALDMGVAGPTITEAVYARIISAMKEKRVAASKVLKGPKFNYKGGRKSLLDAIRDALYCSKVCAYAQGFELMAEAQREFNWKLNFGEIAMIWRGGCIIRARFLQKIKDAFDNEPSLPNLMLDPYFRRTMGKAQANWRKVVSIAAQAGAACPCFMSALAYFDSYRSAVLPANLLQAQRDYFGAHTFERVDQPRGKFFHIDWLDPQRPQIEAV